MSEFPSPRSPLAATALLGAALAAACGSPGEFGYGSVIDAGANPASLGDAASGSSTSGTPDDAQAPPASGDGSTAPVPLGDGGAFPDAASCTLGSAGLLALVPGGTMAPGMPCVSCHASTGAGKLNVAGTVYPSLTEPNLCIGVSSGVQVVITDAQGNDHPLAVDAFGNFYDNSLLGFTTPYTARVVGAAGTVPMVSTQTSGDCNACHTSTGTQGAAGRIIGP